MSSTYFSLDDIPLDEMIYDPVVSLYYISHLDKFPF